MVRDRDPLQNLPARRRRRGGSNGVRADKRGMGHRRVGDARLRAASIRGARVGDGHRGGEAACAARLAALLGVARAHVAPAPEPPPLHARPYQPDEARSWLKHALYKLQVAEFFADRKPGEYMLAAETCGASRSAVESALKALIVAHGVRPRKHKKPADLVNAAIRRHLEQREDFGFESTYSGRSRPRIVRTVASNRYDVGAVFIGTNGAEINIERVRQRVRAGTGHDVPLPEITRRWAAAQKNLVETAASLGAIDVLDNSHGTTRHVASITKGGIRLPATPTPAWARTMLRQDRTAPPGQMTRTRSSDEEWRPHRTPLLGGGNPVRHHAWPPPWEPSCPTRTGPVEADAAVDAQNAPTAPWKTRRVFHELPQGLSHQITHEKPRKAPK